MTAAMTVHGQSTARSFDQAWIWLHGDRVLEGRVEVGATEVTVSQGIGENVSQLRMPASRIRGIATQPSTLYRHIRAAQTLKTPRAFFEFGQWCFANHLRDSVEIVIAEADISFTQDPKWTAWRAQLQSQFSDKAADSNILLASFESSSQLNNFENPSASEPTIDLEGPNFQEFVHTIQPILLGRCRHCHDRARSNGSSEWALTWDPRLESTSQTSQANFASTRNRCRQDAASSSPDHRSLLKMATTAHGDLRQPPLDQRHRGAIDRLERWIEAVSVAERSTVQNELTQIQSPPKLRRAGEKGSQNATSFAEHRIDASGRLPPNPLSPGRLPPVTNPTDPAIFNRQTDAINRLPQQ